MNKSMRQLHLFIAVVLGGVWLSAPSTLVSHPSLLSVPCRQSKKGLITQRIAGSTEYLAKLYALFLESKMVANPEHNLKSRYSVVQNIAALSRATANTVLAEPTKTEYLVGIFAPAFLLDAMSEERYAKHKEVRVLLLTLSVILQCIGNKKAWHVVAERCVHLTETLLTYGWSKPEVKWSVALQLISLGAILYRSNQYRDAEREAAQYAAAEAERERREAEEERRRRDAARRSAAQQTAVPARAPEPAPAPPVVARSRVAAAFDGVPTVTGDALPTGESCSVCLVDFATDPAVAYQCAGGGTHYGHPACLQEWCARQGLVCMFCRTGRHYGGTHHAITLLGGRAIRTEPRRDEVSHFEENLRQAMIALFQQVDEPVVAPVVTILPAPTPAVAAVLAEVAAPQRVRTGETIGSVLAAAQVPRRIG
jgi:hypothetical protein